MREGALPILNTEEWHAGGFRKLDSLRATGNAFAHETSTTPLGPQQGNRQRDRQPELAQNRERAMKDQLVVYYN